jgi:hypothetical protein
MKAINFTEFYNSNNNPELIKNACDFYMSKFVPDLVPIYFVGWTFKKDDSKYKNGIVLTNKHPKQWKSNIVINSGEYSFDDDNFQYTPATFSEFISDVLRNEDFYLEFSEVGILKLLNGIEVKSELDKPILKVDLIYMLFKHLENNKPAFEKLKDCVVLCGLYEFTEFLVEFENKYFPKPNYLEEVKAKLHKHIEKVFYNGETTETFEDQAKEAYDILLNFCLNELKITNTNKDV